MPQFSGTKKSHVWLECKGDSRVLLEIIVFPGFYHLGLFSILDCCGREKSTASECIGIKRGSGHPGCGIKEKLASLSVYSSGSRFCGGLNEMQFLREL